MKSLHKPLRIILAAFLALSSLIQADAGEITGKQAITVAQSVVSQYFPNGGAGFGNIALTTEAATTEPYFVCQVGNQGFVLVSRDSNMPPVLGFSWESPFPARADQRPAAIDGLLQSIRTLSVRTQDIPDPETEEQWNRLLGGQPAAGLKSGVIAPLLATSWDLDASYFDLFPGDYRAGGSVPIAMGQVFRYYARPTTGSGELCYILGGYGELCTKMDRAKFNFAAMSNNSGNPAVDSLVYYMSVACMMQPVGASLAGYFQTLPLHFDYSADMRAVESWNYDLTKVMYGELSLRRPVPVEWAGHSFVIDGYFPENMFHFNMGLGGLYNGFYLISNSQATTDTNHSLMTCYTGYHPRSMMSKVEGLTGVPENDSLRLTWNGVAENSERLLRYIVLRDGLIPVAEGRDTSMLLSNQQVGGSCHIYVIADYGSYGVSDLSVPFRYVSNLEVANIPSLALRQMINTKLGYTDLLRQPFVGELEMIRELEIPFPDQRGIEILPNLKNLRIDGTDIRKLRDGDYISNLLHFRFFDCIDFDYSTLSKSRSLIHLYGYDYLPFDLYDFRHNTNLGVLNMTSIGINPNMLMDLYGVDRYFPILSEVYVRHMAEGIGGNYEDCFVSYESFLDFYPKIKSNGNLLLHTKPTSFAPCYPVPARDANLKQVSRLSWQSNFKDESGVYYNVFVGSNRTNMELVSVFQTEKYYDGTFESNQDYFWRIEAYHVDSTYYSGIYHFSTWQDLPIPFVDRFDQYYANCPVVDESPFWEKTDNALTGKPVANRDVKYEGFYSLEMKPKSEATVVIGNPQATSYFIEFRFLNNGGEVRVELLQKSTSSDDRIVNSRVEFKGTDQGLLVYGGSTYAFNYIPDKWNRVNFSVNPVTGTATFTLNEIALKDWQWKEPIGGGENPNPFKGVRIINSATAPTATAFVDNFIIDLQNPLSTGSVELPEMLITYNPERREVVLSGTDASEVKSFELFDLQGRLVSSVNHPERTVFRIGEGIGTGIYLVVVSRHKGDPIPKKIAITN